MSKDQTPAIAIVVGTQWGDEGKGKLVDIMSQNSYCCGRYNGGANAGHTIVVDGKKVAFHLLPCGMLHPDVDNFIGNGVVLNLQALARECDELAASLGRPVDQQIVISSRVHLTFRIHMAADVAWETEKVGTPQAIGTTRRGIGPSYAAKAFRISLRGCDILLPFEEFEKKYREQVNFFRRAFILGEDFDAEEELKELKPLLERFAPRVRDTLTYLDTIWKRPLPVSDGTSLITRKWHMVIEGANATMLDLNVGSYPYCTSSEAIASGIGGGLSIPPRMVDKIIGIAKAYCTRVGEGPFPTELFDDAGDHLGSKGHEFGASTGRKRRCGWFDVPMLRYSLAINGLDCLMLTKLDVLSGLKEVKVAVAYRNKLTGEVLPDKYFPANLNELNDFECVYETFPGWEDDITQATTFEALPANAQHLVARIEKLCGCPVTFIGVGPERHSVIIKE